MKKTDKLDLIIENQKDMARAIRKLSFMLDWEHGNKSRADEIDWLCKRVYKGANQ